MLLNLLFPKKCLSCGKFGKFICPDCVGKLAINEQLICSACQKNSIDGGTHKKCEGRYVLDGLFSFWQYCDLAKKLIKNLKYRLVQKEVEEIINLGIRRLAKDTSEVTRSGSSEVERFKSLTFLKFLQTKPIIVSVPLHRFRENWRGFNQAALLGREFSRRLGLKFSDKILIRTKETRPQVELKGDEREKNVKGIFSLSSFIVRAERSGVENLKLNTSRRILQNAGFARRVMLYERLFKSKSFLLIDDVWTTGSTLRECAKVLKKAGVSKVWALTLAR